MELQEVVGMIDHTLLGQSVAWPEVQILIDEAIRHGAASVCIPPCFVVKAKDYAGDAIPVCTVVGFPLGYQTTPVKIAEAEDALKNGADEIDMVINLCAVKEKDFDLVRSEIEQIRTVTAGKILKVIVETCLLEEKEKTILCGIVTDVGVDYIKTSTGFAGIGATARDIVLMAANIGPGVKIKASGGITTLEEARRFVLLGASRIGSSRVIKLLETNSLDD